MLIDIPGWTKVVKQKGELVGDQMLMEVAQFLRDTFRGSDIVLRYDMRRFLVIMPETNEHQARCARERMLNRLDSWHLESHAPFELDLRVGMAPYSRGVDVNSALKLAEERLQSGQLPGKADQPSSDLARCAALAGNGGPRREL
jgi:diguanylate cyclase (GGDEF)-like protein